MRNQTAVQNKEFYAQVVKMNILIRYDHFHNTMEKWCYMTDGLKVEGHIQRFSQNQTKTIL